MRITNAGNISCTGSIGCVDISTSGGALVGTYLGIANSTPQSMLHIGNCTVPGSAPVIIFGKNTGGGNRIVSFFLNFLYSFEHYTPFFHLCNII